MTIPWVFRRSFLLCWIGDTELDLVQYRLEGGWETCMYTILLLTSKMHTTKLNLTTEWMTLDSSSYLSSLKFCAGIQLESSENYLELMALASKFLGEHICTNLNTDFVPSKPWQRVKAMSEKKGSKRKQYVWFIKYESYLILRLHVVGYSMDALFISEMNITRLFKPN